MSHLRFCLSIFFFLHSFAAAELCADVIIGNLPLPNENSNLTLGGAVDARWSAGFTMPSMSLPLENIVLRLNLFPPIPFPLSQSDTPILELYGDSGGNPTGPALLQFDNPTFFFDDVRRDYTFTPSHPYTLVANTTYWLIPAGVENNRPFSWSSSSPVFLPTGLATYIGSGFAMGGSLPNSASLSDAPGFQVNTVPEANAFLCVGLIGLVCAGWKRRTASRDPS